MREFVYGSLGVYAVVVLLAWLLRSRSYAAFRAVGLGLHTALACAFFRLSGPLWPLFVYLHATVYAHSLLLVRPAMRSFAYRALVSIPGSFFAGGTLLGLPWAIAIAFGREPIAPWLPYLLALVGVVQSLNARSEVRDIVVADGRAADRVKRWAAGHARSARPLSIVQITDPHLGPFMSVARLRRICERAVAKEPDLVFLTGDFLTMESQSDPGLLARALEPLRKLEGRVFACRGNHDHEAPLTVAAALESAGVRLLIDEAVDVETAALPVQILGLDFVWRNRKAAIEQTCHAHPRSAGRLRVVLLHDPGAFKYLPPGDADLVLSGHTHGGQVGLVSLGLPWTMLRVLMNAPDHGFWARGTDRLYVHRGTGHYGFPLRLGVPAEESLLRVHAAAFAKAEPGT
jgi:predicted MPP superfamily phosphohydrolase